MPIFIVLLLWAYVNNLRTVSFTGVLSTLFFVTFEIPAKVHDLHTKTVLLAIIVRNDAAIYIMQLTTRGDYMLRVQTLNKIAPSGLKLFAAGKYTVGNDISQPDAVLVRSADMHNWNIPSSVQAIARAGAGVNNIPIDLCSERGIVVFNTPGANANAVKELAIAALLLASRDLAGGISWVRTLEPDENVARAVEAGKKAYSGPEIWGKKLGVFGLGAIGTMVANAAAGLGMEVYGYDPYITVDAAWMLSRSVHRAVSPEEIYANCDYIALHVPSTPETRNTICAETIAQMKDGVRIINLAREDLVCNREIAQALDSGKVAVYLTDFPSAEILKMKNVIAIPHLGASTPESEDNCAAMAASELIDYLENGNIRNSVNFPDLTNPRGGDQSICIMHKNIPNILAQMSASLSEAGLNIENLSNRSKKSMAYSVFEISGLCPETVIDKLHTIEGTVKVRVINNR